MIAVCAVLLRFLCVSAPDAAFAHYSSIVGPLPENRYDAAEAKRRGVDISAWDSDLIYIGLAIGFHKACADGACVFYRRHCDENKCVWLLGATFKEAPDAAPETFVVNSGVNITVRDPREMARVVRGLKIAAFDDKGTEIGSIPLARLNAESADIDAFTSCSQVDWYQGCPRPEFPWMRRPRR
jgi:hypothetical protein